MRTVSKKKNTSNEAYTGEEFAGLALYRWDKGLFDNSPKLHNYFQSNWALIPKLHHRLCLSDRIKQTHISNNKELLIPQMFKHYQTNNPGNTNKRSLQAENNEQE